MALSKSGGHANQAVLPQLAEFLATCGTPVQQSYTEFLSAHNHRPDSNTFYILFIEEHEWAEDYGNVVCVCLYILCVYYQYIHTPTYVYIYQY